MNKFLDFLAISFLIVFYGSFFIALLVGLPFLLFGLKGIIVMCSVLFVIGIFFWSLARLLAEDN